ncbi:MAG: cyclase family protein [Bacteroidetes bacterium]|nr:cyclase family protein [Bacteroidota bacterium]
MKLIDLTQTYQRTTPGVSWESARDLEQDGWNASTLHLYSHAGTHVDAPRHFGVSEESIDQMSLDQLVGWAWVVHLPNTQPRELLTVAHLGELAEKISPGDSLLLRTNWSERNGTSDYREALPRISEELARWLVAHEVKMVGVEPPSVADVNNLAEVTLIHQILLGGGITIVEGLCHLDQLSEEQVLLFALPIKYAGGDGAPARVVAVEGLSR